MDSFMTVKETETFFHCKSSIPIHTRNTCKSGGFQHDEKKLFTPSPLINLTKKSSIINEDEIQNPKNSNQAINILLNKLTVYFCNVSDISYFELDKSNGNDDN